MAGTDLILGPAVVGMIDDSGELSQSARTAFTLQVTALLLGGNANGKGPKLSSLIGVPILPIAGPPLFDPDAFLLDPSNPMRPVFWFAPSPTALATIPFLADPTKDYQKIIVDNLYLPLVKMLNIPGQMSIFPIFDPTIAFPNIPPLKIPEFLAELPLTPPSLIADGPTFVPKWNLGLGELTDFISPLLPPGPPKMPPVPPSLPSIPNVSLDFITFPKLVLDLLTIPVKLMTPELALKLITVPLPDFGGLFGKVLDLVMPSILGTLGLVILPKLLIATITIMIQNLVAMIIVDLIGVTLGAGAVCKLGATFFGLV